MPAEVWVPGIESPTEISPWPILSPIQSDFEEDTAHLHRTLSVLQYFNMIHGSGGSWQEWLDSHEAITVDDMEGTNLDMPWWMVPGFQG